MVKDEPEFIREKMWVVRPAGTHLSQAGKPGGFSTLARDDDTNELETHATLYPISCEDDGEAAAGDIYVTNNSYSADASASAELTDEERELLEKLVVLAALIAAQALGPRIKTLWNDRALPSIRRRWSTARSPRWRRNRNAEVEVVAAASEEPVVEAVAAAVPEEQVTMGTAEARDRFIAAMRAREFSDEQLRILRSARIDVDVAPEQLQREMAELPSQSLNDVVTHMLEMKPATVASGKHALAVPYAYGDGTRLLHPDFLFFHQDGDRLVVDIVDPHRHDGADTAPKRAALARYAEDHSDIYRRVLAVIRDEDGVLRALDLTATGMQEKVAAAGDKAKIEALFASDGVNY